MPGRWNSSDRKTAESINIVQALRKDRAGAIALLRDRWDNEHDPATRVRWATAILSLWETGAAMRPPEFASPLVQMLQGGLRPGTAYIVHREIRILAGGSVGDPGRPQCGGQPD